MYSFLYKIYFILIRKRAGAWQQGRQFPHGLQRLLDYLEWFYNVPYLKRRHNRRDFPIGVTKEKRPRKIIASLTSYPKRIGTVWIAIDSIMCQTVKPDEIILWLAKEQFDRGVSSLPAELRDLQNRGLTIRFCRDLKSHKKYFYTLQEYSRDLVILFDDDIFYPRDTISSLMKLHQMYPEDICSMTAQVISPSFKDMPSGWRNPGLNEKWIHSDSIQAYSGSGTLFPPGSLPAEAFDSERIQELCPYADDLWLAFMAHRKGTKVSAFYPWRPFPVMIYNTTKDSLYRINAEQGKNDEQWKALTDYYLS